MHLFPKPNILAFSLNISRSDKDMKYLYNNSMKMTYFLSKLREIIFQFLKKEPSFIKGIFVVVIIRKKLIEFKYSDYLSKSHKV